MKPGRSVLNTVWNKDSVLDDPAWNFFRDFVKGSVRASVRDSVQNPVVASVQISVRGPVSSSVHEELLKRRISTCRGKITLAHSMWPYTHSPWYKTEWMILKCQIGGAQKAVAKWKKQFSI